MDGCCELEFREEEGSCGYKLMCPVVALFLLVAKGAQPVQAALKHVVVVSGALGQNMNLGTPPYRYCHAVGCLLSISYLVTVSWSLL